MPAWLRLGLVQAQGPRANIFESNYILHEGSTKLWSPTVREYMGRTILRSVVDNKIVSVLAPMQLWLPLWM